MAPRDGWVFVSLVVSTTMLILHIGSVRRTCQKPSYDLGIVMVTTILFLLCLLFSLMTILLAYDCALVCHWGVTFTHVVYIIIRVVALYFLWMRARVSYNLVPCVPTFCIVKVLPFVLTLLLIAIIIGFAVYNPPQEVCVHGACLSYNDANGIEAEWGLPNRVTAIIDGCVSIVFLYIFITPVYQAFGITTEQMAFHAINANRVGNTSMIELGRAQFESQTVKESFSTRMEPLSTQDVIASHRSVQTISNIFIRTLIWNMFGATFCVLTGNMVTFLYTRNESKFHFLIFWNVIVIALASYFMLRGNRKLFLYYLSCCERVSTPQTPTAYREPTFKPSFTTSQEDSYVAPVRHPSSSSSSSSTSQAELPRYVQSLSELNPVPEDLEVTTLLHQDSKPAAVKHIFIGERK